MYQRFEGLGNLARDPETRTTTGGTEVCNFTVACDDGYGDNKFTEFVRCVVFGKLASVVGQYCQKGKPIFFAGAIKTRKWEDRDGATRYSTECVVHTVKLLGSRQARQEPPADPGYTGTPDDSQIPF